MEPMRSDMAGQLKNEEDRFGVDLLGFNAARRQYKRDVALSPWGVLVI